MSNTHTLQAGGTAALAPLSPIILPAIDTTMNSAQIPEAAEKSDTHPGIFSTMS